MNFEQLDALRDTKLIVSNETFYVNKAVSTDSHNDDCQVGSVPEQHLSVLRPDVLQCLRGTGASRAPPSRHKPIRVPRRD